MTVRTGAATGVAVAAVDLGATSGRVMVAEFGRDVATLREVARFRNDPLELDDGLHWDITALYRGTLGGLRDAVRAQRAREAVPLGSVGVDSWAVDYGLLAQGHLLGLPFHYRDGRTASVIARTRASGLSVARFRRNGLRDLPFNTEFQLAADDLAAVADRFLLIPDLFIYWMTGTDRAERTNASTTGLLNIATREWDPVAFQAANVPLALAAPLIDPGDDLGNITGPAARMTDAKLPCIAVGSHDTASAVVGVPALDDGFAYVSCGTWGLVGLELSAPVVTDAARVAGFTNELGVDGTVRFLRNVTGLWLLSESLRTWETEDGTPPVMADLLTAAAHFPTPAVFDVDDERFSPPGDMPARIAAWCREYERPVPTSRVAVVRMIIASLAARFAETVREASRIAGQEVRVVHLVGGGAHNALLCQLLADALDLPVWAGPTEATAWGNVLVQARALGTVSGGLTSLREVLVRACAPRRFEPRSTSV